MISRRNFIKQTIMAGAACSLPAGILSQELPREKPARNLIWATLLHLSYNMWQDTTSINGSEDHQCETCKETLEWVEGYQPYLTFDETAWNILLKEMAAVGMNMVIIDLGDAVVYESHPELAVKNACTPEKLRAELSKLRKMGLEPIPKLNFATTHDLWMGEYSRMVSTPKYYDVCRDLIDEVIEIFDRPRFFHLGMDEETASHQRNYNHMVIRQNELWWGDLYYFIGEVEKRGVRPWIWSDYAWRNPDIFFKKMPKSVLQSNWYYSDLFDMNKLEGLNKTYLSLYESLEKYGYDQLPTGSNYMYNNNLEDTVRYCKRIIDPSRLYGFMSSPWKPTLMPCLDKHKEAIEQFGNAIKNYNII
jgi:hypothetical protein